jgi:hypothetical protein
MINPKLKIGDRVVLLDMENEDNMTPGTWGTVTRISHVFGTTDYGVKWDDGGSLNLLSDVDKWDTNQNRIENGKRPLKGE